MDIIQFFEEKIQTTSTGIAIIFSLLFVVFILIVICCKFEKIKEIIEKLCLGCRVIRRLQFKYRIVVILAVIFLFLIAILGTAFYKQKTKKYEDYTIKTEDGKIEYLLGVDILKEATIGNYTYFTVNIEEEEETFPVLYRFEKGKLAERVSDRACGHFEVIKGTILYLDSTICDLSHGSLYISRPDLLNKRVIEEEILDFTIDSEDIYYTYCYDTVGVGLEGHALHRMDLNGENNEIVAFPVSSPLFEGCHFNVNIEGDWAIYDNYKVQMGHPADGTEKVIYLGDEKVDWIFYTTNRLFKEKPDGSEKEQLDDISDFWYQIESIDDKWVYYTKDNDKYRIDYDGNKKSKIE